MRLAGWRVCTDWEPIPSDSRKDRENRRKKKLKQKDKNIVLEAIYIIQQF